MGLNKFCIIIIQAQLFKGRIAHNPGLNLTQAQKIGTAVQR